MKKTCESKASCKPCIVSKIAMYAIVGFAILEVFSYLAS